MRKYLLPETGTFFKANLHCHTTVSDGDMTPQDVKDDYTAQGYSVVAFTDHDVMLPHRELNDEKFLALNGFEIEAYYDEAYDPNRKCAHLCFVALTPEDRYAAAMLTAAPEGVERFLTVPGMLPRRERIRQSEALRQAAANGEDLLCIGTRNRRLMDWCLTSSDEKERQLAATLLDTCDRDAAAAFLRELLCRPFLRGETRQWALLQLAELGCGERVPILMGAHYSIIGCHKAEEAKPVRYWRNFLSTLLSVTRHLRMSNELVDLAADLWRDMPEPLRHQAGDRACYTWCIAVEALLLRMAGEEEMAAREVKKSYLSPRRVSRVLRQISRYVIKENIQTELENGDT